MPEHCVFPARKLQSKICRIPSPRSRRNRRRHRQNYQVWHPADNEPPSGRPCLSGSLAPCRRCRQQSPPPRQLPLSPQPPPRKTAHNRTPTLNASRASGRIFRPRFPDFRQKRGKSQDVSCKRFSKIPVQRFENLPYPKRASLIQRGNLEIGAQKWFARRAWASRRPRGAAARAGGVEISAARPIAERRPANAKRSLRQTHRRDRRETLSRASGTLAKGASRRPYSASFFARSSLMILGLPWPRMAFMHWPTKKPIDLGVAVAVAGPPRRGWRR